MRLLWIIIAIALVGGAWYYYGGGASEMAKMQEKSPIKAAEEAKKMDEAKNAETMAAADALVEGTSGDKKMVGGDAMAPAETPGKKSLTILGGHFYYDIKEIKVKKGDAVTITFRSQEGKHDLKIDEFNASTKVLGQGQEETITFVANKVGEFEYYCSVGNHRAQGQKGKLIVTE